MKGGVSNDSTKQRGSNRLKKREMISFLADKK